jgi:hypothetical protein
MRAHLEDAVARGDYRAAQAATGPLQELCQGSGRLAEALDLAEQMAEYTRQAGLGPLTQIQCEVSRLQLLTRMGRPRYVLAEVRRLRDQVDALSGVPGPDETAPPWSVRETLLDTGRLAADRLGRDDDALGFNAAVITSMRDRRAPDASIARARFNDCGPLLRLGRTDETLALVRECRQVFQGARDIGMLGKTFGAQVDIEDKRSHGDTAISLVHDALRYGYQSTDVTGIAAGYHSLGDILRHHGRQPVTAFASHLAAALIQALTGADDADRSVHGAASDLREFDADVTPPSDVADLCHQLNDIPGTGLPGLIARLAPDSGTAEQALHAIVARARDLETIVEDEPGRIVLNEVTGRVLADVLDQALSRAAKDPDRGRLRT